MVNRTLTTLTVPTTTMMMPIVPATKRSNGFSIDSLMSRDSRKSPGPSGVVSRRSPDANPGSPPSHPRDSPSRSPPSSAGRDREARHSLGSVGGSPRSQPGELSPRGAGVAMGGVGSSFHPVHPGASLLNGLKGLYGSTPMGGGDGHNPPHGFPEGLAGALGIHHPAHPAHAAAVAAAGAAAGLHPHHPAGLPGLPGVPPSAHGGLPPHPLLLSAQRDPFSMYPWLLSRQGGYFGHPRLLGPEASLLLQPFRKPKRIRTAFSPSQLLRLEHAFEKNHYVVGQERKDLAANLNLTETQVKVWFQNRRTKYKRMKQEEAESGEGGTRESGCDSPPHPEDDEILSEDEEQLNVEDDDDEDEPLEVSSDPAVIAHAHSAAMGNQLHPLMYSHAVSMATANQLHYNAAAALQQQQQQQQQQQHRNHRDNNDVRSDVRSDVRNSNDSATEEKDSPSNLKEHRSQSPPNSVPNGQTDSGKRPRSPPPQTPGGPAGSPGPQCKKPRLEFGLSPSNPGNHIERWQLTAAGHV